MLFKLRRKRDKKAERIESPPQEIQSLKDERKEEPREIKLTDEEKEILKKKIEEETRRKYELLDKDLSRAKKK